MALTTNIVSNKDLKETMRETLQFLADTLRNTLGPYGSTTIIQDQYLNHQITKDGYSLLKKIFIEEDEPRTILEMVKAISRTLVRKVGDGSTSSIIIANSLYNALTEIMDKYKIPPKNLLLLLDELTNIISEEIKNLAKPIDKEMDKLKYIAAVSTNNDMDYGVLVADIFKVVGKYGFIDLQKSKTEKTYYEITNGFELPRGFICNNMANQPDRKTCELKDCKIVLVNGLLGEQDCNAFADIIGRVCYGQKQPLCIIAQGYDTFFGSFLEYNLSQDNPPMVVAVDLAMNGKSNQDRLQDISIAVGADIVNKSAGENLDAHEFDLRRLGKCNRLVATEKYCRIIEGQGNKDEIDARIDMLIEERENKARNEGHIELDAEVYELNKRISALQSALAVLYVGGKSEDAKDTDRYLLEDAVFACRSALQFGYIPGGNLIVPLVIENNRDKILENALNNLKFTEEFTSDVIDSIHDSFLESFVAVLNNCYLDKDYSTKLATQCIKEKKFYNLKDDKMETMEETNIINSAETDIEILKTAISIIGLLATSNQFISINTKHRK